MTEALQAINIKPAEKGTAKVTITPTDEAGDTLTFVQLENPKWQLMKTDGTVIDGCSFDDSSLTALSWRLSGNDLAIFGASDSGTRVLSFKATYDSDLGTDNPLHVECEFDIQPLLGQTDAT